jgi:hypothetical protein
VRAEPIAEETLVEEGSGIDALKDNPESKGIRLSCRLEADIKEGTEVSISQFSPGTMLAKTSRVPC